MRTNRNTGANLRHHLLAGIAAIAGLGVVTGAQAQTTAASPAASMSSDSTGMDTVVVTARHYVPELSTSATKLETPLLETPQSVTVINRDQIDLLDWQNLGQTVRYTAGIVGEDYGSDERYDWLTLRGFSPVEYIDGLQAPVGSVSTSGLDVYGSQSVEILKGPASVLYGLAPPGGIINLTSRRPEDQFGGQIQAEYGTFDDKEIAGDVTGAVNSFLSLRFTSHYRDSNTQLDGENAKRFYIAPAATLHINPTTDLTLLSYYQWDDIHGIGDGFLPAAGIYSYNPVGKISTSTNLGDYTYNRFVHRQYAIGYDLKHDFGDGLKFEQNLKYFDSFARLVDVYGAGFATTNVDGPGLYPYLNPLTGVQETDGSGNPLFTDYRTVNRFNFPIVEGITSFNVDSRLSDQIDTGPLHHTLLLGVDYRRYTDVAEYGFAFAPSIDLFAPVHNQAITEPALMPYLNEIQTQVGVYAEDAIKLDRWVLTLSGRQDWVYATNSGVNEDNQSFSYRAGLNYVLPIGLAPYVSYATSFQPTPGADASGNAFKPTTGEQVEVGVKYEPKTLPRGVKILTTLAVYDLKQKNVLETDDANPNFQVQTGQAEVKGIELEGVARIFERLTLNASYSYTDSRVNTDPVTQLTLVPRDKVSIFGDYTFQTGPIAGFGAGVGYRYLSSTYGDTANQWKDPAYGLVDAVVHYDFNKWRVSVEGSNLFDKVYISQCSSETDCFYGLRRKIVATIVRKF